MEPEAQMPDVFLSYCREDQAIARRFAEALEREGFRVWWDQALNPGETFDKVTEKALKEAKAVVVLWSTRSIESRWVRSEATQADRYGTLAPVMIEACERPILFELTHTADLSGWKGNTDDAAWRGFVGGVRRLVESGRDKGGDARHSTVPAAIATSPSARRTIGKRPLLVAGFLAALITLATIAVWQVRGRDAPSSMDPVAASSSPASDSSTQDVPVTSVAVMPFANLTGDPDNDYFGEGIAEELIHGLAKVPELKVASRTSSFAYKERNSDIREIAKDLGVATIIEGSVRSAGDRIRLNAQLTNAESGYQLWSETYDRDFKDLFQLQDELARHIVDAFRRTMSVDPEGLTRSFRPTTTSLEAYVLYMRAAHLPGNYSAEVSRRSVEYLRQALALDPDFAPAHALLALSLGAPLSDVERHARRANELDPAFGNDMLIDSAARRGRWIEAEERFRSLPTETIDVPTYTYHATSVLWPMGKLQDALQEYSLAVSRGPGVPGAYSNLARMQALLGQENQARRMNDRGAELGQDMSTWRTLEVPYLGAVHAGEHAKAGEVAAGFLPRNLRAAETEATVRLVHAAMKDGTKRASALEALDTLLSRASAADVVIKTFAMGWYSQLGALDEAFELAEALRQQFGDEAPTRAWSWLWYPHMAAFRRDARFQPFVTSLGMLPYWEMYGPPDLCTLRGGRLDCR
jgi:TolB-like protein